MCAGVCDEHTASHTHYRRPSPFSHRPDHRDATQPLGRRHLQLIAEILRQRDADLAQRLYFRIRHAQRLHCAEDPSDPLRNLPGLFEPSAFSFSLHSFDRHFLPLCALVFTDVIHSRSASQRRPEYCIFVQYIAGLVLLPVPDKRDF
ncbi:hypothetical protein CNECB9_2370071 [Cupriavidus necator]|uniref:Uncharacterized protein n=1 Tax=Cupriavidus necator TaxID=106590 RepID=A0A1K0IDU3_CUPNE|nr:hypothetical protein CNECB9_2370071 [Cupriavidus necator]